MSINPVTGSNSVPHSQPLQSSSPGVTQNEVSTLSSIESPVQENWFSSFISKIFQWLKKIFPCLDTAPTARVLTAQELQERIQKGREFIINNVDCLLGNSARNLQRDKFLVVMSYNNSSVAAFPTSHPIDLNQLKRDAIAKFEAMMHQPGNSECLDNNHLMVDTYYFARQIRSSDGALSPFIVCESDRHYRCFGRSDTGDQVRAPGTNGAIWRVYDNEFNAWLNEKIPASAPERQAAIGYALGALRW